MNFLFINESDDTATKIASYVVMALCVLLILLGFLISYRLGQYFEAKNMVQNEGYRKVEGIK